LNSILTSNIKNSFFEISKNVINISTSVDCYLFENEVNKISFDKDNIKRYLLLGLLNSNYKENCQKREEDLLNSNDSLNLLEDKSLLFINYLEREVNIYIINL